MTETRSPHLSEYWMRELKGCEKAFSAGVELGLYQAVLVCYRERVPPQPWMLKAMLHFMEDHMGKAHKTRGRTGNSLSKYRQDLIHYTRWDTVVEVREQQELRRQDRAKLEERGVPPWKIEQLLGDLGLDLGKTFEDAFRVAAELLKGTPAFGSESTIRASYLKVEQAWKEPEQQGRFFLIREPIRRHFDVDV